MMTRLKDQRRWAALIAAAGLFALPGVASAAEATIDPTDAALVPNPVVASDPGTQWTCAKVGGDVQCTGDLSYTWESQPGPDDWCSQPLFSVDGQFDRRQTRYYSFDPITGSYLETKRLIHLDITDSLVSTPDAPSSDGVATVLRMMWVSDFTRPGDLDSRITRKQGIDTMFKAPHGGVFTLDVGQEKGVLGEDFDFHGRWDIALGDGAAEFTKVCTALGLT
jgi:hypothetical protein